MNLVAGTRDDTMPRVLRKARQSRMAFCEPICRILSSCQDDHRDITHRIVLLVPVFEQSREGSPFSFRRFANNVRRHREQEEQFDA
jgi:hypothetical protein